MSIWSQTLEVLKKAGLSRSLIKKMYGSRKVSRCINGARALPKGYLAKRKRLKKAQKEARRRNR